MPLLIRCEVRGRDGSHRGPAPVLSHRLGVKACAWTAALWTRPLPTADASASWRRRHGCETVFDHDMG